MRLPYHIVLALNGYYGQPVLPLYIYIYFFLYHVNQCRVQLGTSKVVVAVVAAASIYYNSILTDITHMDDSLFFIFRQYLKKLLNRAAVHLSFICLFV